MKISKKILGISFIPLSVFVIGAVISALLVYSSNNATNQYISQYVDRQVLALRIFQSIGYGQGIHSFKNYILRHDNTYRTLAEQQFKMSLADIKLYLDLKPLASEELVAMSTLQDTIKLYVSKLSTAEEMIKTGRSTFEIDHSVKVNDDPAIAAITNLQSFYLKKRDVELAKLKTTQEKALLVIIIMLAFSILVGLIISRGLARRMIRSIKKLLSISSNISKGNLVLSNKTANDLADDELKSLALQLLEMARTINQSIEKIKAANKELEDFAFVASHDLQEPIKKISAYVDFLEQDDGENLSSEGKQLLFNIKKSSKRMLNLIRALLDYSTMENANLPLMKVDLNLIVKSSVDNLQLLIEEKSAEITIKHLPEVVGNRSLLQSLFQNLIANAIKFQKPNSKAEIIVSAKKIDQDWRISIEDNGIGFDIKNVEKIFRPFGRAHDKNQYPGTGIGLATCKKIVKAHNSDIEVKSEKDKGSTFSFLLRSSEAAMN